MDWQLVSYVAACVQTVLLLAAAFFAIGQVREASRARKLAILMPLRYGIDSLDARRNRYSLFNELPEDLTSLSRRQDEVVDRVVVEYDHLGKLVQADLIDFDLLAQFYSLSTERCWRRVEPWVRRERERRGGDTRFCEGFETFAQRCIKYNARHTPHGLAPFRRPPVPVQGRVAEAD